MKLAVDLHRRRVYIGTEAQAAYDWLCERFADEALRAYGCPVEVVRGALRASEGWSLEFAAEVSNQLDGIPVLTNVIPITH